MGPHMARAADADRRERCRLWVGLQRRDQLLEVGRRQVGASDHHERRRRDQRDRLEIGQDVVGHVVDRDAEHVRRRLGDAERVAVGWRARDLGDAQGAARTRHIVDDDRLAERPAHALGEDAAQRVGRPAGGEGNDHGDGTVRPGLRRRRAWHRGDQRRGQPKKNEASCDHWHPNTFRGTHAYSGYKIADAALPATSVGTKKRNGSVTFAPAFRRKFGRPVRLPVVVPGRRSLGRRRLPVSRAKLPSAGLLGWSPFDP